MIADSICFVKIDNNGLYDANDWKAALRSVQRFLRKKGFLRGKRSGTITINPDHLLWRDTYIRKITGNRTAPPNERLLEVYTDESYVHQHHYIEKDDLYHPSSLPESKSPHKGRRYCFISAIQFDTVTLQGNLVPNSYWRFCPSDAKSYHGDYHKVFNLENYLKRFTTNLLPNLDRPSLIVLDNAKYHCSKPMSTPNVSKLKRSDVIRELNNNGISFDASETVVELKKKLRNWIQDNVEPAIVQIARSHGHEVIYTPPHFSDLQPIEMVWARVKSAASRGYSKEISLQDVRTRLDQQFLSLNTDEGSSANSSIVLHVDKII